MAHDASAATKAAQSGQRSSGFLASARATNLSLLRGGDHFQVGRVQEMAREH
jgi:hypothetical protein